MAKDKHIFEDGFGRPYSITNEALFDLNSGPKKEVDLDKAKKLLGSLIKKRMEKVIRKEKAEELTDPFVDKVEKYLRNPGNKNIENFDFLRFE